MTHPHPGTADALRRSTHLLDVLSAQLHDVVAATEEAALAICTDVQDVDAQTSRLEELARALRPTDPDAADHLDDAGARLGTAAVQLLGRTQFQDVTRQAVEGVLVALARLGEQLAVVADRVEGGAADGGELPDPLAALEEAYVSARQREVHARAAGAPVDAPAPEAVELF